MSDAWYYAEGDKSIGPISLADLIAITPNDASSEALYYLISWSGVMPNRTTTPYRKMTTNECPSIRKARGIVDRTSGRSSPAVSMWSPSNKALTGIRGLLWLDKLFITEAKCYESCARLM